jgi:translation elongation factor EF-4
MVVIKDLQRDEKIQYEMLFSSLQIAIQAAVGGKIVARETLKAYRKDVTAKLVSAYSELAAVDTKKWIGVRQ